jgi:hypothetical protein
VSLFLVYMPLSGVSYPPSGANPDLTTTSWETSGASWCVPTPPISSHFRPCLSPFQPDPLGWRFERSSRDRLGRRETAVAVSTLSTSLQPILAYRKPHRNVQRSDPGSLISTMIVSVSTRSRWRLGHQPTRAMYSIRQRMDCRNGIDMGS